MIFRSPIWRDVCILTGLVAGLVVIFGNEHKWRSTDSLKWLDAAIPLQVWGVLLILHALLLLRSSTRPVGYALGFIAYGAIAVSLLWTLRHGGPKNILVAAGMVDLVAYMGISIGHAEEKRGGPR